MNDRNLMPSLHRLASSVTTPLTVVPLPAGPKAFAEVKTALIAEIIGNGNEHSLANACVSLSLIWSLMIKDVVHTEFSAKYGDVTRSMNADSNAAGSNFQNLDLNVFVNNDGIIDFAREYRAFCYSLSNSMQAIASHFVV